MIGRATFSPLTVSGIPCLILMSMYCQMLLLMSEFWVDTVNQPVMYLDFGSNGGEPLDPNAPHMGLRRLRHIWGFRTAIFSLHKIPSLDEHVDVEGLYITGTVVRRTPN